MGCLFAEAVIGLDPGWGRTRAGRQLAYPVRLLLVVLLVPFHAVLGLALLSAGEPVAADWYLGLGRTWGASPLADQRTGAGLMWGVGDVIGVVLVALVAHQWMRADEREARRVDARRAAGLLTTRFEPVRPARLVWRVAVTKRSGRLSAEQSLGRAVAQRVGQRRRSS